MNARSLVSLALLACLCACRDGAATSALSSSGGRTDAPDATTVTLPIERDAPSAVSEDAATSVRVQDAVERERTDGGAQTPNGSLEQLIRAMAANPALITASVRSPRGLSLLRFTAPPPSGRGRQVHSSQHLCGDEVRRRERELHAIVAMAVRRADEGQGIECDATSCTVSGMEFEETRRFRFRRSAVSEQPQLESIELVTTAAMGPEWIERMEAFVRRSIEQHIAHPCATR
jgi:hypothetical protein